MSEDQGQVLTGVIVLDRVVEGVTPEYCLHGSAQCVRCHNWVHLGHETSKVVQSGQAHPVCMECVHELVASGEWPADQKPSSHVQDHRRADGPHEPDAIPEGWLQVPCANPSCRNVVWVAPEKPDGPTVVAVCSAPCTDAVMQTWGPERRS